MNLYLIIVILLAFAGVGAGGFKLGVDHEVSGQKRAEDLVEKTREAAMQGAALEISKIKVTNKTIQSEVQKEVRYEKVYTDVACNNTPNGMRLLNQALTGDKPTGDSKLPEANPAVR